MMKFDPETRKAQAVRGGKAPRRARGASVCMINFDYTADQLEFMQAMTTYKQAHNRPFPTLCETLAVLVSLGYTKPSSEVNP